MTVATRQTRELTHDELVAADARLAEWLVGEPGHSLLDTYPQIFAPDAEVAAYGAFEGDSLRSHAAVRRVRMSTSQATLEASLVGVVATDPTARGAQLASGILHRIADREIEAGQDIIVLWSDLWEFYAKLGYAVAGVQAELSLTRPEQHADGCRPFVTDDLDAITELHAAKPWRVIRDRAEMQRLTTETRTDGFVLERDDTVVAYAFHGKGVDFPGWWHEFGGSDEDVAALIPAAMHALDQPTATVLLPPYRNELLDRLVPHGTSLQEGAVALCKPLTDRGRCQFFIDGLDSV